MSEELQSQNKFIINDIYPIFMNIVSEYECILISLAHQVLDDRYLYIENVIRFKNKSLLKPGTKIRLVNDDIKKLMGEKNETNTFYTSFNCYHDETESKYYYTFKGSNYHGLNCMTFFAPRQSYIRIKYMLEIVTENGGFPKSSSFIFTHKKMNFIKIEEIELEGSKVMQVDYNTTYSMTMSTVKNAYKFRCGGKWYPVIETMLIPKELSDHDLRIPVPEFVFTSVYVDKKDAVRLVIDNGDIVFLIFNDHDDNETTVFIVPKELEIQKLSPRYIVKGNDTKLQKENQKNEEDKNN